MALKLTDRLWMSYAGGNFLWISAAASAIQRVRISSTKAVVVLDRSQEGPRKFEALHVPPKSSDTTGEVPSDPSVLGKLKAPDSDPPVTEAFDPLTALFMDLTAKGDYGGIAHEVGRVLEQNSPDINALIRALGRSGEQAVAGADLPLADKILSMARGVFERHLPPEASLVPRILFDHATVLVAMAQGPGSEAFEAGKIIDLALAAAETAGVRNSDACAAALKRFVECAHANAHYELAAAYAVHQEAILIERYGARSAEVVLCRIQQIECMMAQGAEDEALDAALSLRLELPNPDASGYLELSALVEETAADLQRRAGDYASAHEIAHQALERLLPLAEEKDRPALAELLFIRGRCASRLGRPEEALKDVNEAFRLEASATTEKSGLVVTMGLWLAKKHAQRWEPELERTVTDRILAVLKEKGIADSPLVRKVHVYRLFMFQRERDAEGVKMAALALRQHLLKHEGPPMEMLQCLQYIAQASLGPGIQNTRFALENLQEALDLLGDERKIYPEAALELLNDSMYVSSVLGKKRLVKKYLTEALIVTRAFGEEARNEREAELRLGLAECLRALDLEHLVAGQVRRAAHLVKKLQCSASGVRAELAAQKAKLAIEDGALDRAFGHLQRGLSLGSPGDPVPDRTLLDLLRMYADVARERAEQAQKPQGLRAAVRALFEAERCARRMRCDRVDSYYEILSDLLALDERLLANEEKTPLTERARVALKMRKSRFEERLGAPE